MITALDTNVLLDILTPGAPHGDETEQALRKYSSAGALIICEAVYAELASHFEGETDYHDFLGSTGVSLSRTTERALLRAGKAWTAYVRRRPASFRCPTCGILQSSACQACGTALRVRQHVLPDFLIGAHAEIQAERLMTRDRGFYATNFPDLTVV